MKSRETAIINDTILLTYVLLSNGYPTDAFTINNIRIYNGDPDSGGTLIQTILPADIHKTLSGHYEAIMTAVTNTGTYYDLFTWTDLLGVVHSDKTQIVVHLAEPDTEVHKKKGFAFNNPDLTYKNGWGAIITPDELRYQYMYGLSLTSLEGDTMDDFMLQDFIDAGVGFVERELNLQLYKRKILARPIEGIPRIDLPVGQTAELDYFWDEPYDYRKSDYQSFMYLKLRKRPIVTVDKVMFRDPMGTMSLDITQWKKVNYRNGSIEFFPNTGSMINVGILNQSMLIVQNMLFNTDYFPDAFFVDYTCGFESAAVLRAKYPELFTVCGYAASLLCMVQAGEGRLSGIASQSLSLGDISESFNTTGSAENTLLSAKMRNIYDYLKNFFNKNKKKYGQGLSFASL
jgi:hypothetical protein